MQKCSTGTDSDGHSDGDSYGQFLGKLLKFHLISTDIGAKMGTVPIGIGRCIGIGLGSAETLLHITIEPIFICIGIGIGVGQWKHTIMHLFVFLSTKTTLYNTQKRTSCQEMEKILRIENDLIVTCDIYRVLTGTGKVGRHFFSQEKYWKTQKNVICSDIWMNGVLFAKMDKVFSLKKH